MREKFAPSSGFGTAGNLAPRKMARHLAAIAASDPAVAETLRNGASYRIRIQAGGMTGDVWSPRPQKTEGDPVSRETTAAYAHVVALARPYGLDGDDPASASVTLHPLPSATERAILAPRLARRLEEAVRLLEETGFADAAAIRARV